MDIEHIITELKEGAAEERANLSTAQVVVDQHQANLDKLEKALEALTGASPKPTQRRKRRANGEGNGRVSQETRESVLRAIVVAGEQGITKEEIQAATGLSHSPVGRALMELREDEKIRKAGIHPDTQRHIFKVMPDA